MKVASLFTGCGGLDLGFVRSGHEIVLQVEIDDACRALLKARFPGVLLRRDVAEVDQVSAVLSNLLLGR